MERFISNFDLSRFNLFLQQETNQDTFYYIKQLPSLEEIFRGNRYYSILFKEWPGEEVGHWVLLIKMDENYYEYFDCLGDPVPPEVFNLLEQSGESIRLESTSRPLMNPKGTICGKWCMLRLMCLPNSLKEFLGFFNKIRLKPDEVVNFIINLPVNE